MFIQCCKTYYVVFYVKIASKNKTNPRKRKRKNGYLRGNSQPPLDPIKSKSKIMAVVTNCNKITLYGGLKPPQTRTWKPSA